MPIREIALDGGIIRLTRDRRSSVSGSTVRDREPARLITFAWGDRYVTDLLSTTIPAILAPGNLPSFAEWFDCELTIVTESRLFDSLSCAPVIVRALDYADVRLVPIDDLLSPWYGITLTHALVRGFSDLGQKMTETHLVFFNADFIVADGSLRTLAQRINNGERLVVAPSYCMNLEESLPALRTYFSDYRRVLSIAPRDLAALAINYRHNTVRAKTVNQQLFRIHRYDQFYWHIDDTAMLAQQMPVAVVYMRPERVLTEMPTFWDYGVISEYCPDTTPCVLGDSDDFLMAELRSQSTAREFLRPGWPTIDEIAHDLSSFTTKDHRDYGRHTLLLHSAELPSALTQAKKQLTAFVDSVYARLGPPVNYRQHPFWTIAWPRFQTIQATQRQSFLARMRAVKALANSTDGHEHNTRIAEIKAALRNAPNNTSATALLRELNALVVVRNSEIDRLLVRSQPTVCVPTMTRQPASNSLGFIARARVDSLDWLTRRYHLLFGEAPHTTIWHPLHSVLTKVLTAIDQAPVKGDVLIITSGGLLTAPLSRRFPGRKLVLSPEMAIARLYEDDSREDLQFDLCFLDLSLADLLNLQAIIDAIRPRLRPPGKIIAFHAVEAGERFDLHIYDLARTSFPLTGTSHTEFTGSRPAAIALHCFMDGIRRHDLSGFVGQIKLALTLAAIAPLARLGTWIESRRDPKIYPPHCTSMMLLIDLK